MSPIAPQKEILSRSERRVKRCQDTFLLPAYALPARIQGMGRPLRSSLGGFVYHVLNRGNARATIFHKDGDYEAFERVLASSVEHVPGMRLLAYCTLFRHSIPSGGRLAPQRSQRI